VLLSVLLTLSSSCYEELSKHMITPQSSIQHRSPAYLRRRAVVRVPMSSFVMSLLGPSGPAVADHHEGPALAADTPRLANSSILASKRLLTCDAGLLRVPMSSLVMSLCSALVVPRSGGSSELTKVRLSRRTRHGPRGGRRRGESLATPRVCRRCRVCPNRPARLRVAVHVRRRVGLDAQSHRRALVAGSQAGYALSAHRRCCRRIRSTILAVSRGCERVDADMGVTLLERWLRCRRARPAHPGSTSTP
jgi:hypothetical protein